jgi:peptide/nickel transport system permease protein
MLQYLVKRLLLFIPTLLLISMLAFGLSKLAPGDPVSQFLINDPFASPSSPADLGNAEKAYQQAAATLNLDKPAFYFSIQSSIFPDTLYKIVIAPRRETLRRLVSNNGNWAATQHYYLKIKELELMLLSLPDSVRRKSPAFKQALRDLYGTAEEPAIAARFREMKAALATDSLLASSVGKSFGDLENRFSALQTEATPGNRYLPAFHWHGLNNQYHQWLTSFLKGDFGISLYERLPVARKVKPALFWTLALNITAILLAYLISIPLGVHAAVHRGKRFDRASSLGLFMLYSLPSFWIGTLLLIFFTTGEYGMNWFDAGLHSIPLKAPWWEKLWIAAPRLILPIICITYPAVAYISRQMRGAMTEALQQDYIRTARAKGLPERQVIWRHAFRNALFPLITIFSAVFPAAIAGSVAIESIFTVPGMGWLTLHAILQKDWPVVFTLLMLGATLTLVGMLVADLLYAVADPRVKLAGK